jgi:5-methylcytosine-specific restriction protein A
MPLDVTKIATAKPYSFADNRRGSRQERGYGAAWTRVRTVIMNRDGGLCQPCLDRGLVTVANAVDHVVPKAQGGSDDESNLQAICNDCHQTKTVAEALGARGIDGVRPSKACTNGGQPTDPKHPWNNIG